MTATHVVNPLGVKLALAPSLTVYVAPGVRPPKVAVPLADMVVPLVEIVAVALTDSGPPVRVKVKLPVPPTVFLVTTIEPRALFANGQTDACPATPMAEQVVALATGTKPACAPSVTAYPRAAGPGGVAVPGPAVVGAR